MNLKKIHLILFLKPYYNWNAFNTWQEKYVIIQGDTRSFKPYSTGLLKCSNWSHK